MKRLLLAVMLACICASGQTINTNQIRPSATNNQIVATSAGKTQWQDVSTLFQSFANCAIAGYVYSPASSGCVQAGSTTGPQYALPGFVGSGSGSSYALGATGIETDSTHSKLFITSTDTTGGAGHAGLVVTSANSQYGVAAVISSFAAGQQAVLYFNDGGDTSAANKWQFGKNVFNQQTGVGDDFFVWDNTGGRNILDALPNGDMTIMPSGCTSSSTANCNVIVGNSYSPFNVTAAGDLTAHSLKGNISSDYIQQGKFNFTDGSYSSVGYGYSIAQALAAVSPTYGGVVTVPQNGNPGTMPANLSGWVPGTVLHSLSAIGHPSGLTNYSGDELWAYDAIGDTQNTAGKFSPFTRYCNLDNYSNNSGGGGANITDNCLSLKSYMSGAGSSFGNPGSPFTVNGWSGETALPIVSDISAAAIVSAINTSTTHTGVGDTASVNHTLVTKFGGTAASDEQVELDKALLQESTEATATLNAINDAEPGPTTWSISNWSNVSGAGQIVVDVTKKVTGGSVSGSGNVNNGLATVTLTGITVTPSTCSTLAANVLPAFSNAGYGTSETFTVNAPTSGSWSTTSQMFIMGAFPEELTPTGVSGNSITAIVRNQHASGEEVCQGGPAGWSFDQPNVDNQSGYIYNQFIVGATTPTSLIVGYVASGALFNQVATGPIVLYPTTILVAGENNTDNQSAYDGKIRVQPNSGFAVGDTIQFPNNVAAGDDLHFEAMQVSNPYAAQRVWNFALSGQESLAGTNFAGVWNYVDQANLTVQKTGNHTLYAPHGLFFMNDEGGHLPVMADLITMGGMPVGGKNYSNISPPYMIANTACWPSNIDTSKVQAISNGSPNYDLFWVSSDNAHLNYTPTCSGGNGYLTWTGTLDAQTGITANAISGGEKTPPITNTSIVLVAAAQQTVTLNANITTMTFPTSPIDSAQMCVTFVHDATTTAYTVAWPANVEDDWQPGNAANGKSTRCFRYSPSLLDWVATGSGTVADGGQVAANISLGVGWGTGATATAVTGTSKRFRVTVTAGTGTASDPTLSATFPSTFPKAPICVARQTGGSGSIADISGDSLETTTSTGSLTWLATPVASSTYILVVDCR